MFLFLACTAPSPTPSPTPIKESEKQTESHQDSASEPLPLLQGLQPELIIVMHTDTLRLDHLPMYGYTRQTFPYFSSLKGQIRWESYYSTSSWTPTSTASLLTGLDIPHHQVRHANDRSGDDLLVPSLVENFAQAGMATALFAGNTLLGADNGFSKGFSYSLVDSVEPSNAIFLVGQALSYLDTLAAGQKAYLHIQAYDPHQPWYPSPQALGHWSNINLLPFSLSEDHLQEQLALKTFLDTASDAQKDVVKQQIRNVYDEELLGLDGAYELLIKGLIDRGRLAKTLVVFTADHGETLFDENDYFGHGATLREELVRLPLIFYNPSFSDQHIENCLAWNVDLLPTLLMSMGLTVPMGLDGIPLQSHHCRNSISQSIYGGEEETDVLLQIGSESLTHKLIRNCNAQTETLYDLRQDPSAIHGISYTGTPPELENTLQTALNLAQSTWPDVHCELP